MLGARGSAAATGLLALVLTASGCGQPSGSGAAPGPVPSATEAPAPPLAAAAPTTTAVAAEREAPSDTGRGAATTLLQATTAPTAPTGRCPASTLSIEAPLFGGGTASLTVTVTPVDLRPPCRFDLQLGSPSLPLDHPDGTRTDDLNPGKQARVVGTLHAQIDSPPRHLVHVEVIRVGPTVTALETTPPKLPSRFDQVDTLAQPADGWALIAGSSPAGEGLPTRGFCSVSARHADGSLTPVIPKAC